MRQQSASPRSLRTSPRPGGRAPPPAPPPGRSPAARRPLPPPCGALPHYNSQRAPRRGVRCACAVPRPGSEGTRPGHVGAILWPGVGAVWGERARRGEERLLRGLRAEEAEGSASASASACCRTKQGRFCSSSCSATPPQPVGGAVRSHPSAGKPPGGSRIKRGKIPKF